MKLRELQILAASGDRPMRKAVDDSAAVVQAALSAALPAMATRGTAKVVVRLWHEVVPPQYSRYRSVAPDGRDGDDVDEVNEALDLEWFSHASLPERRRILLDVLCSSLRELGIVRRWDVAGIERACGTVRANGIEYLWEGPKKASPSRRLTAAVFGGLDEDGAFVRVKVYDRDSNLVTESREERVPIRHPQELKVRADRVRWEGEAKVCVDPRPNKRSHTVAYGPMVVEVPTTPPD